MDETSGDLGAEVRRKRAPKACLSCRVRKVRCDVAHRGPPCINCFLDKQQCVVKARKKKYGTNVGRETSEPASSEQMTAFSTTSLGELKANFCRGDGGSTSSASEAVRRASTFPFIATEPQDPSSHIKHSTFDPSFAELESECQPIINTHVMYSYYSFLKLDGISKVSTQDVNFLEAQGCFRVPTRPILDEFVQEYFLHIQPILPFLNERTFWSMYPDCAPDRSRPSRMSLFVFQTMLFAASSFVSLETIQKLGFRDNRSARSSYYRRAKLLFDFDAEMDSISLAQGTLLMSYHSPMVLHKKSNTYWLATAIQFAKDAGAHRYETRVNLAPEKRNTLKRLWWCAILRDRILPLGLRRPLQITLNDFDLTTNSLRAEDFEDEIGNSKVYDAPTKTVLIQILIYSSELAVCLTDVIMLLYPSRSPLDSTDKSQDDVFRTLAACKQKLSHWYENTTISCSTPENLVSLHESLALYLNLIYMYYHAAMMALSHHEVFITATSEVQGVISSKKIFQSKQEIENSISGMTENLKEIVQLKLAKYMPISVVAYAALPLVLHLLDVKLARTMFQKATKQRRLNIYTETMRALQSQYDVTDNVSETISKMIGHISLEKEGTEFSTPPGASIPEQSSEAVDDSVNVNDWCDVFLRQPTLYLRMTFTVDLYLMKGRFPDNKDFPLSLQSRTKPENKNQFPPYRINIAGVRRPSIQSDGEINSISKISAPSFQASEVAADRMTRPIDLDAMDFESSGLEIPMGFEAFDIELFSRRGMEFDYPQAWAVDGMQSQGTDK